MYDENKCYEFWKRELERESTVCFNLSHSHSTAGPIMAVQFFSDYDGMYDPVVRAGMEGLMDEHEIRRSFLKFDEQPVS